MALSLIKKDFPVNPLLALFLFDFLVFFPFLFTSSPETFGAPTGDLPYFFKPMREYAASELNQGRLPYWNPYTSGGRPFMADPETGIFYPFTYLFLFLPSHLAFSWIFFIHYLIAGWGMLFFCRRLGISSGGSLLAAMIFSWSSPHLLHMYAGHFTMIQAFAWTPWLLWSLEYFLSTQTWRSASLSGLFLSLQLLAGFPLYTYLCGWLMLSYGIYRATVLQLWTATPRLLPRIMTGILLGCAIFTLQGTMTYELIQHSTRDQNDLQFSATYALDPQNLMTLLVPHYLGQSADIFANTGTYFGRHFIWENSCHMGIAGLIFFLTAFGRKRHDQLYFWAPVFLFGLFLALGSATPIFEVFHQYFPGFSLFRGYSKALTLSSLALAIMAGMGLDRCVHITDGPKILWPGLGVFLTLAFMVALGFIHPAFLPFWKTQLLAALQTWDMSPSAENIAAHFSVIRASVFISTASATLVIILIHLLRRGTISAKSYSATACLLAGLELFIYSRPYLSPLDFQRYQIPDSLVAPLQSTANKGRVIWTEPMIANLGLPKRIYATDGYENFPLKEYSRLINLFNNTPLEEKNPYLNLHITWRSMRFFAVNHIVGLPQTDVPPNIKAIAHGNINKQPHILYKAPWEWPRLLMIRNIQLLPEGNSSRYEDAEKYGILANDILKGVHAEVWLEPKGYAEAKVMGLPSTPPEGAREWIRSQRQKPGNITFQTHLEAPAVLVINENFYPGWSAALDGNETGVHRANLTMKAVILPQGDHNLHLTFLPLNFAAGLAVSALALAALCGLIALNPGNRPKETPSKT